MSTSSNDGSIHLSEGKHDASINDKHPTATARRGGDASSEDGSQSAVAEDLVPDDTVQEGVRRAEAVTLTWSKTSLAIAYLL